MLKDNIKSLIVFIIYFLIFFVVINFVWWWLNRESTDKFVLDTNIEKIEKIDNKPIGQVWVALTTNIWIKYKELRWSSVYTYNDSVNIWYAIASGNSEASDDFISTNMLYLWEYFNILKTDIKNLVYSSNDRSSALNAYIAQLEYRYKESIKNLEILNGHKINLEKEFNLSSQEIEEIKQKMDYDYGQLNPLASKDNISEYKKYKAQNTNAYTYVVFINRFINSYNILNSYNSKLLDTLINNKDIIIKDSQIVLPSTGNDMLRDLNLIVTEDEWKRNTQ